MRPHVLCGLGDAGERIHPALRIKSEIGNVAERHLPPKRSASGDDHRTDTGQQYAQSPITAYRVLPTDAASLDDLRVVAVTEYVEHERLTRLISDVENDFGTTLNTNLQPATIEESNYSDNDADDRRDDEEVL